MRSTSLLVTLASAAIMLTVVTSNADSASSKVEGPHSFWRYVSKNGDISRPDDNIVRRSWVHLGTWAIPKVKGASGPGMHDVYTERWVLDSYNKTHAWPDGAVLVKQVHDINKGARTTGPEVYWEGKTAVWFVMVKDRHNRFPDDKRWGEGWGWALFKADKPNTDVNKNWKQGSLSNCFACHQPAKNTDWVYLEGYPILDLTKAQKRGAAEH